MTPSDEPARPAASPLDVFRCFAGVSLTGFGGVLNWIHHAVVERRRWLTDREFAEVVGVTQVLPGAQVVNIAIQIGERLAGAAGAAMAAGGLLLAPFLAMLAAAIVYERFGDVEVLRRALTGLSAVAPGFVAALGVRMALQNRRNLPALAFIAAAFLGVGVLRLPLLVVLAVLAPLAALTARWMRR